MFDEVNGLINEKHLKPQGQPRTTDDLIADKVPRPAQGPGEPSRTHTTAARDINMPTAARRARAPNLEVPTFVLLHNFRPWTWTGQIPEGERSSLLNELLETGMPVANAQLLMQGLVKEEDLSGAETTRELTTAQIVRGTKNGLISFDQGKFLLKSIGWRDERAEFMLRLQVAPEDAVRITELGQRLITQLPQVIPEFETGE